MSESMKYVTFSSAVDLMNALTSRGDYAGESNGVRHWIFRGQKDISKPLKPTALRQNKRVMEYCAGSLPTTQFEQINLESKILLRYYEQCDEAGLSVPDDSLDFREKLAYMSTADQWWSAYIGWIKGGSEAWLPRSFISLAALAQHYDLPTRLLDWSFNPYIAAYFAARNYASPREDGASDVVGIYALEVGPKFQVDGLQFISAPYAMIPNLRAQKGLFSIAAKDQVRSEEQLMQPVSATSIETIAGSKLHCLTLPLSERASLIKHLSLEGYNAATVFPGFAGAGEATKEVFKRIALPQVSGMPTVQK